MKAAFAILTLIGLSACTAKQSSDLKHLKVQSGERLPALVISGLGISGSNYLKLSSPNLRCNTEAPQLPLNFVPSTDAAGLDPNCDVYGYTKDDGPFWLSKNFPGKTILMDKKRFANGISYPLGNVFEAINDSEVSVSLCTRMQTASDVKSEASCIAEQRNFFEKELGETPEGERSKKVAKAVIEALQVLTYSDPGLSRCYEKTLLETEAFEKSEKMPTDPAYNIFQSIRRRDDFFPVTDIELAFLNSKIKTIPQNLNETYVFRHGLAKRLGHVTPSKSSLGDLYPAYEPLSLDVWKSVLRQGLESSVSTFGEDAKGLANLPVLDIFAKIETIMNRQNGLNIIQAKGYVSNLTKSSDENVKMSEQLTISRTEMKIFSDLIYRAVLLAKATELNPFSILPELEEKIGESCEDYAKYSLAVQNKRDEIILNYTLSDENDARPALSFAINRAPIREWLTDSTKKELKNGESPVVLDRSIGCGKDWSTDFCPLLWTSTRSSRFKSLNVRVIDVFNVSQPVWERIIDRPARSVEIVSASAFRDLLRNGFFRTQGIDPTLEIEGVFESNGREGRTLLFSHKLTRKEGPLDDLVIDCSQTIHDDKSEFECDLGLQARGFSISAGYCENDHVRTQDRVFSVSTVTDKIVLTFLPELGDTCTLEGVTRDGSIVQAKVKRISRPFFDNTGRLITN